MATSPLGVWFSFPVSLANHFLSNSYLKTSFWGHPNGDSWHFYLLPLPRCYAPKERSLAVSEGQTPAWSVEPFSLIETPSLYLPVFAAHELLEAGERFEPRNKRHWLEHTQNLPEICQAKHVCAKVCKTAGGPPADQSSHHFTCGSGGIAVNVGCGCFYTLGGRGRAECGKRADGLRA